MILRILLVSALLFACSIAYAQTPLQGLTPGRSSRSDVERVYGQPTAQITERLIEYRRGTQQIYVQYSKASPTAVRFQMILSPPAPRADIVAREALPPMPELTKANKSGAVEEYFGNPRYVVLTYAENSLTEVSQIGYFSRELYDSATPEISRRFAAPEPSAPRAPDIPSLNATVTALRFFISGSELIPYGQRRYASRFPRSETRFVNWELNFAFPAPGRDFPLAVDAVVYRDDGSVDRRFRSEGVIPRDWTSAQMSKGNGHNEPGQWAVGRYWVELFVEGRKVAVGSFEIY